MSSSERESRDPVDAAHWDAVEEVVELLHEERYREALDELHRILSADPKNPYGFYFTGVAMYESGQLAPARDAYRACIRLAPNYLGARVALTHVLRALGETKEAVREGMEALSRAPGDGDTLHAVGLAYLANGDTVAAKKYLTAFLDTHPEFEVETEVRAMLGSI